MKGGRTTTNTIDDIPLVQNETLASTISATNRITTNNAPRVVVETSSSSSSIRTANALAPIPPSCLPRSDYLVSEHEDNDEQEESQACAIIGSETADDDEVTADNNNNNSNDPSNEDDTKPTEIPPEENELPAQDPSASNEDNESDYEYDYEDDDEGQYSGFLLPQPSFTNSTLATVVPQDTAPPSSTLARSRDDHVVEAEEDECTAARPVAVTSTAASVRPDPQPTASKWNQPSREAISMSLRAEKETTGGRRRLAADLYKIMTQDTREAGFSIGPRGEDRMDAWTIKLFQFDEDSNLSRDLRLLGLDHVELEMNFPGQYPFEPPFVRIVRPRFKRQTGFVMNGALCMELLTNEGWNPVNDIESVIVSIRSLLVVGDGRLQAAVDMPRVEREAIEERWKREEEEGVKTGGKRKRDKEEEEEEEDAGEEKKKKGGQGDGLDAGQYTTAEAKAAYSHLSNFHKKKGWSHWWAKKG